MPDVCLAGGALKKAELRKKQEVRQSCCLYYAGVGGVTIIIVQLLFGTCIGYAVSWIAK
jgi:hypothetical protein